MKRLVSTTIVLLAGLLLGFVLRSSFEPSRAERMAQFLDTICGPYARGGTPDFEGLVVLNLVAYQAFGDPKSTSMITLSDEPMGLRCRVTDQLAPMEDLEKDRLLEIVNAWVDRRFPELTPREIVEEGRRHFVIYSESEPPQRGEFNVMFVDNEEAYLGPNVTIKVTKLRETRGA